MVRTLDEHRLDFRLPAVREEVQRWKTGFDPLRQLFGVFLLVGIAFELLGLRDGTFIDIVGDLLFGFDVVEATLAFDRCPDGRRRNVVGAFVLGSLVSTQPLVILLRNPNRFDHTYIRGCYTTVPIPVLRPPDLFSTVY